jgi:hypothetical protein
VASESGMTLRIGPARWMTAWQLAISALSIGGVLMSRAGAGWIALFLGSLLAANMVGFIRMRCGGKVSRLHLHGDGHAIVCMGKNAEHAWQLEGGWASRWCCVVPLRVIGTGRRLHCLVCRSCNAPDAYRRLLVSLRLCHGAPAVRSIVQA